MSSRKMSIMPASKVDDDERQSKSAGSKGGKGVGFMDLVQFHVE